jgi:hypothetical protein
MNRKRSTAVGIALFGISFLLTLLVVEGLLRMDVLLPTPPRRTIVEERPRSRMDQPDFRQPGFELTAKREAFRILVVGDSFSWGDGVYWQDAYPNRLQARLNEFSRGERFEVVNWSRPGWNTLRQVRSVEKRLAEIDPDLVILGFVLNDPEPVDRSLLEQMLSAAEGRQPRPGVSAWLFEHSQLYRLVWTRFENSRTHRELSAFYLRLYEGEHWEACRRALKRLRNRTRGRDVPLVLLIFPVFDSPMDERYPYRDLHHRVAAEGRALGVPVFDLFAVFEGMDTARLAAVPFTNAHPTEIAHRVAADGILSYLVRKKLLPALRYRPQRLRRPPGR